MANKTLLEQTYELLDGARGNVPQEEIARGSNVTYTWLTKFSRRAIPEPGVERVQRVHDFLMEVEAA